MSLMISDLSSALQEANEKIEMSDLANSGLISMEHA